MWALDDELNRHFEWVRKQRDDPDDHDRDLDEPASVGPMLQNEYAKNRGRNAR